VITEVSIGKRLALFYAFYSYHLRRKPMKRFLSLAILAVVLLGLTALPAQAAHTVFVENGTASW
jgi:hypothetical protein